jgi:hypothetical protein
MSKGPWGTHGRIKKELERHERTVEAQIRRLIALEKREAAERQQAAA